MTRASVLLVMALGGTMAACERAPEPAPTHNATAMASATPTPQATGSAPADLSRFIDKYPFDKVGETSFITDPLVVKAVRESGADARIQELILGGAGPQTPIKRIAGKIVSWGCEAHNCGPHNWTIQLLDDGSGGEVCYFNEDDAGPGSGEVAGGDTGGAAKAAATPVWFADGKRSPRTDPCPSGN